MSSDLRATVVQIKNLCARGGSVDELIPHILCLHRQCPLSIGWKLPPELAVYRATNHHACLPEHVADLSYPPETVPRPFGRCNRAGQSMFYGSLHPDGAPLELHPPPGSMVVVAQWKVVLPIVVHDLGYSPGALRDAGSRRELNERQAAYFERLTDTEKDIREFIARAFTDPTDGQYTLTAAITEAHTMATPPIGGVKYPSIRVAHNIDNLALTPASVDTSLVLVAADAYHVTRRIGKGLETRLLAALQHVNDDGTLTWEPAGTIVHIQELNATLTWDGQVIRTWSPFVVFTDDGRRYLMKPGYQLVLDSQVFMNAQGKAIQPEQTDRTYPDDN
jgi:hypothetical protein